MVWPLMDGSDMNEQTDRFWRRVLAEIDDGGFFDRPGAHDLVTGGSIAPLARMLEAPERLLTEATLPPDFLAAAGYPSCAGQEWLDCMPLLDCGWPPLTPDARPVVLLVLLLMLILFVVEVAVVLFIGA